MNEVLLTACQLEQDGFCDGTVGRLLEGVDVRVLDPQQRQLPPHQVGELWIRSPFMFTEYMVDEGLKNQPLPCDEWLPTGDLGHIDEAGRLAVTGRLKDLIIRGGVNVSPQAVEAVLLSHPGVREAAVVGEEHPFWGEEVVAFVVLEDDANGVIEELSGHCKVALNADSIPCRFQALPELPRSPIGKVLKAQLKQAS